MGRMTPGRDKSREDCESPADESVEASFSVSTDCAWALNLFSSWPTLRLSSALEGLSQLSPTRVNTPDLRPNHASRKVFREFASVTDAASESKRARSSAKSDWSCSGETTPRVAKFFSNGLFTGDMVEE